MWGLLTLHCCVYAGPIIDKRIYLNTWKGNPTSLQPDYWTKIQTQLWRTCKHYLVMAVSFTFAAFKSNDWFLLCCGRFKHFSECFKLEDLVIAGPTYIFEGNPSTMSHLNLVSLCRRTKLIPSWLLVRKDQWDVFVRTHCHCTISTL